MDIFYNEIPISMYCLGSPDLHYYFDFKTGVQKCVKFYVMYYLYKKKCTIIISKHCILFITCFSLPVFHSVQYTFSSSPS